MAFEAYLSTANGSHKTDTRGKSGEKVTNGTSNAGNISIQKVEGDWEMLAAAPGPFCSDTVFFLKVESVMASRTRFLHCHPPIVAGEVPKGEHRCDHGMDLVSNDQAVRRECWKISDLVDQERLSDELLHYLTSR